MPYEPTLPPQLEGQQDEIHTTQQTSEQVSENETPIPIAPQGERPHLGFSPTRWISTGAVRLLYRFWTRIAAKAFPENSRSEQLARSLHIPLPDKLNMSWVTANLAVGGRVRPEDIRALSLTGITDVIDTRSEYQDDEQALAKEGMNLLYLPTPDTYPLSVEQLMQGAEWANQRIRNGRRVLIHCEHGVGRSVLLTAAVLVYNGMHARNALALVQDKRWQAAPNHRQVSRLKEFESALATRRKA